MEFWCELYRLNKKLYSHYEEGVYYLLPKLSYNRVQDTYFMISKSFEAYINPYNLGRMMK